MTSIQEALNYVDKLSIDEQEALIDIIRKRIIETRRNEIALNAGRTVQAVRDGKAKYGDIDDLKENLNKKGNTIAESFLLLNQATKMKRS